MTANKEKAQEIAIGNEYDKVPYTSYPFDVCAPEFLKTRAILFGLNPPELSTARILDIGSASGGNVIRFASLYLDSYTLGIDLSEVQIERGQKKIAEMGLQNIELKAMSVMDLDESYGKFDYIICYGVFSWVPDSVKDKILEVTKTLLTNNGLALISYNTFPGWNQVNTVREMMMYHSKGIQDDVNKFIQAKYMLGFINESLQNDQTPYAKFMLEAADYMADKDDDYIWHEYLGTENTPMYFYQFIKKIRNVGLEYVCDAALLLMYTGTLPANVREKFSRINNIVDTEQYLDFINNTQFRSSILCHNGMSINRNIPLERLKLFYIVAPFLVPVERETPGIYLHNEPISFYCNKENNELQINIKTKAGKAVFYVLAENPGNPLTVDEIVELASKKVPDVPLEQIEKDFMQTLGHMIFLGYLKIFADKPIFTYKISDKPEISRIAAMNVNFHDKQKIHWVINQINEPVGFESHYVYILNLLDGKHSVAEIRNDIFEKLKTGEIVASNDDKRIENEKILGNLADSLVREFLNRLRTNYCLVG